MKVGFQTDGVKLRAASDLQALDSDNHLSGSSSRREKQVVSSSHTSVQFSQTSSASALESHSFPWKKVFDSYWLNGVCQADTTNDSSKWGRSRVMLQNPVVHLSDLCSPKWPWWLSQAPTPRLNSSGMKFQPHGFQIWTLEHLLCPFWAGWPWASHFTSLTLLLTQERIFQALS